MTKQHSNASFPEHLWPRFWCRHSDTHLRQIQDKSTWIQLNMSYKRCTKFDWANILGPSICTYMRTIWRESMMLLNYFTASLYLFSKQRSTNIILVFTIVAIQNCYLEHILLGTQFKEEYFIYYPARALTNGYTR